MIDRPRSGSGASRTGKAEVNQPTVRCRSRSANSSSRPWPSSSIRAEALAGEAADGAGQRGQQQVVDLRAVGGAAPPAASAAVAPRSSCSGGGGGGGREVRPVGVVAGGIGGRAGQQRPPRSGPRRGDRRRWAQACSRVVQACSELVRRQRRRGLPARRLLVERLQVLEQHPPGDAVDDQVVDGEQQAGGRRPVATGRPRAAAGPSARSQAALGLVADALDLGRAGGRPDPEQAGLLPLGVALLQPRRPPGGSAGAGRRGGRPGGRRARPSAAGVERAPRLQQHRLVVVVRGPASGRRRRRPGSG